MVGCMLLACLLACLSISWLVGFVCLLVCSIGYPCFVFVSVCVLLFVLVFAFACFRSCLFAIACLLVSEFVGSPVCLSASLLVCLLACSLAYD